jgi:hypothetical protein
MIVFVIVLISLCACAGGGQNETTTPPSTSPTQNETPSASSTPSQQQDDSTDPNTPVAVTGEVVITFDYEKISGSASNQWAVWIEDMDGNYINTVYATRWTAGGGFKTRPDSIALWVEKSDIASMPDYYVDAISGATPKAGTQSYTWNLQDINGDLVLPGDYKFFVEGTLRWKNYVLYSGIITIGDAPMTAQADAEYVYEASDRQAALMSESSENAMITAVAASFQPAVAN